MYSAGRKRSVSIFQAKDTLFYNQKSFFCRLTFLIFTIGKNKNEGEKCMSKLRRMWLSVLTTLLLAILICIGYVGVTARADEPEIGVREGAQSYNLGYNVDNNRAFRLELSNADDAKTQYGGFETLPSAVDGKTNGDLISLTGKDGTKKTVNEWKSTTGTQDGDTNQYIRRIAVYGNILHFITDTKEAQNYFTEVKIEAGVRWYVGTGGEFFWGSEPTDDIKNSTTTKDVQTTFTVYRNVAAANPLWSSDSSVSLNTLSGAGSDSYINDPAGKPHFNLTLSGAADARSAYGGFETLPSAADGKTNGDLIWLLGKDGRYKTVNEWKTIGDANNASAKYIRHVSVYSNRLIFVVDASEANDYFVGATVDADVMWYVGTGGGSVWNASPPADITSSLTKIRVGNTVSMYRSLTGGGVWNDMPAYEIQDGIWKYADDAMTLETQPKTEYRINETFDFSNMKLSVRLQNGEKISIGITQDLIDQGLASVSSEMFGEGNRVFVQAADNAIVSVKYLDFEVQIPVSVRDEWIASVTVKTNPEKTSYDIGEFFDATGLSLEVTTNKGNTNTVEYSETDPAFTLSKFDNGKIGKQTINGTYQGMEFSFDISVENKNPEVGFTVNFDAKSYKNDYSCPIITFKFEGFTPEGLPNILWGVDKMPGVGDKVLINGMTLDELRAQEGAQTPQRLTLSYSGTVAQLEIALDNPAWKIDKIKTIEFIAGFRLITAASGHNVPDPTSEEDCLEYGYTYLENAVLRQNVILYNYKADDGSGRWVRLLKQDSGAVATDAVELTTSKSVYKIGEPVDLGSLSLKVRYEDDRENQTTIPVTEDMIVNPDFSQTNAETAEIKVLVSGHEYSVSVTIDPMVLDRIEIVEKPANLVGNLGREFDFTGLKVNAVWKNQATGEELAPEEVNHDHLEFFGYDPYILGEQTVTVSYTGKTAELAIEYKDLNPELNLTIRYSGYANYETNRMHDLIFYVNLNGYTGNTKALTNLERFDNVADYIYIDGKSVTQLMDEGLCDGVRFWTDCVIVLLNGVLQPNQEAFDAAKARSNGAITDDMEPIFIKEVTIKAGFQYYTADADNWGGSNFDYQKIEGCFLREDITLENLSGLRWRRPFAEGENALTINTMPDKVVYQKGEYFDITGLTLKAKFKDGGEEILTVADSWVNGYDMNKVGEQTITISYNGGSVEFTVTVEEEEVPPSQSGCNGCGSSIGIGDGIVVSILLIGLTVMMWRRKREER